MNLRRLTLLLLVASAFARPAGGEPVVARAVGPMTLLVDAHRAVVRGSYEVTLADTNGSVRIDDLPPEADLGTLSLIDRRRELRLHAWARTAGSPRPPPIVTRASGRQVTADWNPDPDPARLDPGLDLTLRLLEPGTKRFDLVYVVTGISWRVTYDVLLRGELRDVAGPMSMDVEGWVEVSNATSRAYRDARLLLVGTDSLGFAPEAKAPGILELDDDTPLADLWRHQAPEPTTAHFYTVEKRVDLDAHASRQVSLVSVTRKPVERVLVVRAEQIPTDVRSRFAHPSQIIRFDNAGDYGGNRAVPPGRALIHIGNQRSALHQQAWFKHTPANGEITLDVGPMTDIRIRRVDRGRRALPGGFYEHQFELRMENSFPFPVSLIVDEQPPFRLAWTPVRSSLPFEQRDRRLIFRPTISANGELVLTYTLRVEVPRD